jgi:hypothetical protein
MLKDLFRVVSMKKSEFASAVNRLANEVGLRHVSTRKRLGDTWVGVYRGILVVLNLDSVRLQMELTSPSRDSDGHSPTPDDEDEDATAEQGEVEVEAEPFLRATDAGLPGDWFEQNLGEPWGFQLVIDGQRRRGLSPEAFDGILDRIAEDLHDLGAENSQPCECNRPATTLGYFETPEGPLLAPYCDQCWEAAQLETRGVIRINEPKNLLRGWAFLATGSVVFATIWGCSQHPQLGLPFPFLFLGCTAVGVAMAVVTSWFAEGSNLGLRLGVAAGVITATLAGNIVGVKFLLEADGLVIPWPQLIPAYFLEYFPAHIGQEVLFLSGGVVGVVIGFFVMRDTERIRLR